MRTSLLKLSLTVSTGVELYLEGMEQSPSSDFSKGSGLSIYKLTPVTGEDCTAGFNVVFPEALDLKRQFLCVLLDTLLWIY